MDTDQQPDDEIGKESSEIFSVNDWDLEKAIFGMVISLVNQKSARMAPDAARESVKIFLSSLIAGLETQREDVNEKIEEFLKQQRKEAND